MKRWAPLALAAGLAGALALAQSSTATQFIQRAVLDLTRGGTINGDLTVSGDAGVTKNVNVVGTLIAGVVDGGTVQAGALGASGQSTLAGVTASTVKASVVDGGTVMAQVLAVTGTADLGGTTTGAWSVQVAGTVAANTDYGAFYVASTATGVKFREVACWSETGAGTGTGTLAIRNVTDATTLCSGSINCALSSPVAVFDCGLAPVAGKVYALRVTSACSVVDITTLGCNIEVAH